MRFGCGIYDFKSLIEIINVSCMGIRQIYIMLKYIICDIWFDLEFEM